MPSAHQAQLYHYDRFLHRQLNLPSDYPYPQSEGALSATDTIPIGSPAGHDRNLTHGDHLWRQILPIIVCTLDSSGFPMWGQHRQASMQSDLTKPG